MDKVDATMAAVNEQRELANEIADTIATPLYTADLDEVCSSRAYSSSIITDYFFKEELKQELEDLAQDELNERLNEADHVPVHQPPSTKRVEEGKFAGYLHTLCIYRSSDENLSSRADDKDSRRRRRRSPAQGFAS